MTTTADPLPTGGTGYDPDFLDVGVPLPTLAGTRTVELPYLHFTVLLRPDRRLAAVAVVNIDGASLREVERGDDWRLDPRVGADEQTGGEVYADNPIDRGHLVRRRSAVWGTDAEAQAANDDTFYYTNAAPQVDEFNQSEELWLGLEDYLLDNARANRRRLSVFTGPVLDEDDPAYRGVRIPLRFWKVAAFVDGGELASTAYVLDQTPLVEDLPPSAAEDRDGDDPPPLGPYRTFQVPVAEITELTGLDLGPLVAADRYQAPEEPREDEPAEGVAVGRPSWRPLTSLEDVVLQR